MPNDQRPADVPSQVLEDTRGIGAIMLTALMNGKTLLEQTDS